MADASTQSTTASSQETRMNIVSSKRAVFYRADFRDSCQSRFRTIRFRFDFRFRERPQRFHGSRRKGDRKEPERSRTAGEHQRFRLLHHHEHSARGRTPYRWKPRASRNSKHPTISSIPARRSDGRRYADGRRGYGDRRSDGDGGEPADGIGCGAEQCHAAADRCSGAERPQPDLHGEPGSGNPRRQPLRSVVSV